MNSGLILLTSLNILLIVCYHKKRWIIARTTNLIDKPNKRSIHNESVPSIGGLIIVTIFILNFSFFNFFGYENYLDIKLLSFLMIIFFIGYIDDIKSVSPLIRLSTIGIIYIFFFYSDQLFMLKILKFDSIGKTFDIGFSLSVLTTILCVLLLINAVNLVDGINSLAISIIIFWLIYLSYKFDKSFSIDEIIFLWPLFVICILNFKNYFFLGNSGSLFLGGLVSSKAIYTYNIFFQSNKTNVEEIFLLLLLPGLDMLRVFFVRIINKKHPFSPDKTHLHHYLIKRFNNFLCIILYLSIIFIMMVLYNLKINFFIILISYLVIYFSLLQMLSKKVK